MANLVRMSEAASIALHACLWMARKPDNYCSAREICAELGFSAAHFAKVMQLLSRAGLVSSTRGPTGGSRLARSANKITLMQIYESVDGPVNKGNGRCLLAPDICSAQCCMLGKSLASHNNALQELLTDTTLADFAQNFKPKKGPLLRL